MHPPGAITVSCPLSDLCSGNISVGCRLSGLYEYLSIAPRSSLRNLSRMQLINNSLISFYFYIYSCDVFVHHHSSHPHTGLLPVYVHIYLHTGDSPVWDRVCEAFPKRLTGGRSGRQRGPAGLERTAAPSRSLHRTAQHVTIWTSPVMRIVTEE